MRRKCLKYSLFGTGNFMNRRASAATSPPQVCGRDVLHTGALHLDTQQTTPRTQ
jgi:hypothetical protein